MGLALARVRGCEGKSLESRATSANRALRGPASAVTVDPFFWAPKGFKGGFRVNLLPDGLLVVRIWGPKGGEGMGLCMEGGDWCLLMVSNLKASEALASDCKVLGAWGPAFEGFRISKSGESPSIEGQRRRNPSCHIP